MKDFLIKLAVNIVALFVIIHAVGGVSAEGWSSIIVAAFILGLLNAFIRPVIILFTLPFTILTLGLFTLVINAFLFYITSKFVKGFEVIDFWSAFWAALLFSIISAFLNFLLAPKTNIRYSSFRRSAENSCRIDDDNVIDVEGKTED